MPSLAPYGDHAKRARVQLAKILIGLSPAGKPPDAAMSFAIMFLSRCRNPNLSTFLGYLRFPVSD
jgi:hypothetical protein